MTDTGLPPRCECFDLRCAGPLTVTMWKVLGCHGPSCVGHGGLGAVIPTRPLLLGTSRSTPAGGLASAVSPPPGPGAPLGTCSAVAVLPVTLTYVIQMSDRSCFHLSNSFLRQRPEVTQVFPGRKTKKCELGQGLGTGSSSMGLGPERRVQSSAG